MSEEGPMDRLLPCLLDRLTDAPLSGDATGWSGAALETADRRVVSMAVYRRNVLRDLQLLLNSHCEHVGAEYRNVRGSVLQYGIPDFSGKCNTDEFRQQLKIWIIQAIEHFEPRIRHAVVIDDQNADSLSLGSVSFRIQGTLWAEPRPETLNVRTVVDLQCGKCEIEEC